MISIDYREGSKELEIPLKRMGLPVKVEFLAYGDASFLGRGPSGPLLIGIEYKKLSDLLQSWHDGRLLGHQLPGMMNAYDVNYLLVEGAYSCNSTGGIDVLRRNTWKKHETGTLYGNLRGWLVTLQNLYGVRVLESPNLLSTAAQVASIYSWWTKDYSKHGASVTVHQPDLSRKLMAPTPKQKVAAQFPGVGSDKLVSVEETFTSVRDMVNAPKEAWLKVKGVGEGTFKKIEEFLS